MNVHSAKSLTFLSLVGLFGLSAISAADNSNSIIANPDGYHVVPTQNSPGTAIFKAKVDRQAQTITYDLSWSNLKGNILQSHIHFGRQATNGDIALFLCTNLGNTPATAAPAPLCSVPEDDQRNGEVKGVLHASDMVALPFGGVTPVQQLLPFADFDELANAIDAEATYVVVHTQAQPPGELRGNISAKKRDRH